MKCRTFKQIRADLEGIGVISNKGTFLAALPVLVEACVKVSQMRRTIKAVGDLASALNERCSAYALDHESTVFVNGLTTDGKGVRHGDVDVDGVLYHFASGFGKFIREDGDNITQTFLASLPEKWVKGKIELDVTAINRLGVTTEELQKAGLVRSTNDVWSLPTATTDGGDE